ncbi:hypothetical protein P3T37_005694 [Kitasatospora sp. MAA4]|uniref:hypothetical protein n=1 Tax=Kitasatospora sp. MAA4 TaxID=3035093 RepID=UPI00247526E6|nr:hypothetical protein [Kitasatospora sp. MAA4]MDH6136274.1 hypothetical protein [Kitasatospora sp. MAA4]
MRVRPSDDICRTGAAATCAQTEAEARAAFLSRASGAELDAAELLDRVVAAPAPRTGPLGPLGLLGPLGSLGEGGLAQFPLRACQATVADPDLPAGAPTAAVTGYGGDRDAARLAAALAGLAAYGTLAADRSRPAQAEGEPTVWGMDLVTGALRRVPAREAFPAPDRRTPYRAPIGAAAGLTWVDALESALAQHVEALLARRLADPGTRVPRLDLRACDADDRGAQVLGMLHSAGEMAAHDLSGLLSVPACAIRIGPHTVIATGATPAGAVHTATERALAAWQSHTALPIAKITPEQESPAVAHQDPADPVRWAHPHEALRGQGRTPVAVLLDHDPRVVRIMPYLVQVVLIDE